MMSTTEVNKFLARLHVEPNIPYLELRGVYALVEVLQEGVETSVVDDVVFEATAWIIVVGSKIRNNDVGYVTNTYEGLG